jgi:hypothetical protein
MSRFFFFFLKFFLNIGKEMTYRAYVANALSGLGMQQWSLFNKWICDVSCWRVMHWR